MSKHDRLSRRRFLKATKQGAGALAALSLAAPFREKRMVRWDREKREIVLEAG